MKKNILFLILGLIIAGSVGVYASIKIRADEISYNDKTVEDALNDLYLNTNTTKICKFESNEYGEKGNVGSEYICDVNLDGTTKLNFYVLDITGETVTLIMKHNITEATSKTSYTWMEAYQYLYNLNWKIKPKLPEAQDIVDALELTNFNISNKTSNNWFCLGLKDQSSCTQGGYTYSTQAEKDAVAKYQWLFNYTYDCIDFGCSPSASLNSGEASGYWTNNLINEYRNPLVAWGIFRNGFFGHQVSIESDTGIRPAITILKSNLYE